MLVEVVTDKALHTQGSTSGRVVQHFQACLTEQNLK